MENSSDSDFIKRTICIFGYSFDSRIVAYPLTDCKDPDAEYYENLPDFNENLNDFLLREVHQADMTTRNNLIMQLEDKEQKIYDDIQNTEIENFDIGSKLTPRTITGKSEEGERLKRIAEANVKRQLHQERRRRQVLEDRRRMKEEEIKKFQAEIKADIEFKKKCDREDLKVKQIYGAARAEELRRRKQEREKKRQQDLRLQEEALKTLETIQMSTRSLQINEEDLKQKDQNRILTPEEKRARMREISNRIKQRNFGSTMNKQNQ